MVELLPNFFKVLLEGLCFIMASPQGSTSQGRGPQEKASGTTGHGKNPPEKSSGGGSSQGGGSRGTTPRESSSHLRHLKFGSMFNQQRRFLKDNTTLSWPEFIRRTFGDVTTPWDLKPSKSPFTLWEVECPVVVL